MKEGELIETLRAFEKNRVEQLEEPAKNLFYAIMKIADERDRLNNIIKEAKEFIYENAYNEERNYQIDDLWYEIPKLLDILNKGE